MHTIYLISGDKKLSEISTFSHDFKGNVYSSQHVIPVTVAFQVAMQQGRQDIISVPDLNVYSVGLNNYCAVPNLPHLINSNRRSLFSDLRRVSSFIESKLGEDAVIVLNRPHYDGLHYVLFGDIQESIVHGNSAWINHFHLNHEDDNTFLATSVNRNPIKFGSLSDEISSTYKDMRWKTIKF